MPFVEGEQVIEEKKSPILKVPILSYLQKKKKKKINDNNKVNPLWLILLYCIYCIIGNRIDVSYFFIIC